MTKHQFILHSGLTTTEKVAKRCCLWSGCRLKHSSMAFSPRKRMSGMFFFLRACQDYFIYAVLQVFRRAFVGSDVSGLHAVHGPRQSGGDATCDWRRTARVSKWMSGAGLRAHDAMLAPHSGRPAKFYDHSWANWLLPTGELYNW